MGADLTVRSMRNLNHIFYYRIKRSNPLNISNHGQIAVKGLILMIPLVSVVSWVSQHLPRLQ